MAVDGRTHVRVFEIQARGVQLRVQRAYVARGLGLRRRELLVLLTCNGVLRIQALGTGMPGGRVLELGLCALEFGGQALDLDLERARVDLKQHLSLADPRPFGELHTVDEPADAGTHFDRVDRLQLPGEFIPMMQWPGNHLGDGDRSRWRCSIGPGLSMRMAARRQYDRANRG